MKKCILVIFSMLFLVACGNSNENAVCTRKEDIQELSVDIEYEKDDNKVVLVTYTTKINIEESSYTKEDLETNGKEYETTIKTVNGVSYSYEIKDNVYTEILEIDLEEGDLDALSKLGLITKSSDDAKTVKLKSLLDNYEALGLECEQ